MIHAGILSSSVAVSILLVVLIVNAKKSPNSEELMNLEVEEDTNNDIEIDYMDENIWESDDCNDEFIGHTFDGTMNDIFARYNLI